MPRTLDAVLIKGNNVIPLGQAASELDRWEGTLLNATAAAYTGEITAVEVNKSPEGFNLPVPASVVADGKAFEVVVRAQNTGTETFTGGVEVIVTDPDGIIRVQPPIDWTGISPTEELEWQYQGTPVDKAGAWTAVIRFLAQ